MRYYMTKHHLRPHTPADAADDEIDVHRRAKALRIRRQRLLKQRMRAV